MSTDQIKRNVKGPERNPYIGKKYEPPFDKMLCWKCCGDGKLPAKCDRDKSL